MLESGEQSDSVLDNNNNNSNGDDGGGDDGNRDYDDDYDEKHKSLFLIHMSNIWIYVVSRVCPASQSAVLFDNLLSLLPVIWTSQLHVAATPCLTEFDPAHQFSLVV